MKICNNCQSSVQDEVKFCSACGSNSFTPEEQSQNATETPVIAVNPTETVSNIPVQNTEPIQAQTGFIPASEPISVPVQNGDFSQPQAPAQPVQPQGTYQQPNYQYQQPPMAAPVAPAPVNEDGLSDDNKVMAAFCYVPMLSWIMYLVKPEDKGVVNCANQGFWLLLLIVGSIAGIFLGSPFGALFAFIFFIFILVLWIFALIGFIKVLASKECFEIPVVGKTPIFKVKNK